MKSSTISRPDRSRHSSLMRWRLGAHPFSNQNLNHSRDSSISRSIVGRPSLGAMPQHPGHNMMFQSAFFTHEQMQGFNSQTQSPGKAMEEKRKLIEAERKKILEARKEMFEKHQKMTESYYEQQRQSLQAQPKENNLLRKLLMRNMPKAHEPQRQSFMNRRERRELSV